MRVRASDVFVVGACAVVGYTYAGYPLLMRWAAARHARRPPVPRSWPSLSVVVPAFNETLHIKAKIANVVDQDYPAPVEVIVVADGSSDDTATLAGDIGAVVLWERERRGKSVAVNRGVAAARGDVVVLTDANCMAVPGAFRALARHFADPSVGVVSGAKTVAGHGAHGSGEGLYWRLESALKASESDVASTMGAPGELCAVRRASWRPIPPGIINDDYHITCDALIRGLRVTYDAAALTEEAVSDSIAEEWERRTRIAAGTWQTTFGHLALCAPRRKWVAVSFISHRVLRSVVVPPLLVVLWLFSAWAQRRRPLARVVFWGGTAVAGLAAGGVVRESKLFAVPFQFVFTNAATMRGALRYLTGRQPLTWRRAVR